MPSAWILLALLAAGDPQARVDEPVLGLCSPGTGAPLLVLDAEGLREGAGGQLLHALSAGGPALFLACAPGRAYLGIRDGRGGRLLSFRREAGRWSADESGPRTRGVPVGLLPVGERLAVLYERRGECSFALIDSPATARPSERPLPALPTGLALAPDATRVLVAVGAELRTFSAETGGTSVAYLFPDAVEALAARPGIPRVLVGVAGRVLASDPDDPATRGALPVREEAALEGRVVDLAWTGAGEAAAVLTADPPRVSFLSGEDLGLLDRMELPRSGVSLAARGPGRVTVILEGGEVRELSLDAGALARAAPPRDEPLPRDLPEEGSDVDPSRAARPETVAAPGAAAATALEPPAPKPEAGEPERSPEEPPVLQVESEAVVVTGEVPPAVEPEPGPAALEPEPGAEAAAETRGVPPAPEPGPATEDREEPTPTEPEPAAETREERPKPEPVAVAEAQEEPPTPEPVAVAEAQEAPPPESGPGPRATTPTPPRLPEVPPPGTVAGRIGGKSELVAEVLLLGPDNVMREAGRFPLLGSGGERYFVASGLAPGRYRVMLMGPGASSLATRPRYASVLVGEEAGARADFEVLRGL